MKTFRLLISVLFAMAPLASLVQLEVVLRAWNGQYVLTTSTCDEPGQQLIFSVPGVGPNAPQSLLIVSFADTEEFAWL